MTKLNIVIAKYTPKNITLQSNLIMDLGLYSMEVVSLIHDIEVTFNIQINYDEYQNIQTVNDLNILVQRKISERS
ncbi:acyl carrier protein [Apilactobacillus quenuiae]|uniref:acyl carrier protein n=1 Tax=Apilactobacillus quenuiae TaxID=2008377 RepID=UPI000D018922|nr:phosphopantetheine-binding protein [Apilactobacillus quenuiae]